LYRAPSGDFNQFVRALDATLMYLCNPKYKLLIFADINIDCLIENNRKIASSIINGLSEHDAQYLVIKSIAAAGNWSASCPGHVLLPGKGPQVPVVQQAVWAPELVWV
jgi:hypothetical protein